MNNNNTYHLISGAKYGLVEALDRSAIFVAGPASHPFIQVSLPPFLATSLKDVFPHSSSNTESSQ
jgi:hypothetical protein